MAQKSVIWAALEGHQPRLCSKGLAIWIRPVVCAQLTIVFGAGSVGVSSHRYQVGCTQTQRNFGNQYPRFLEGGEVYP